MSYKLRIKDALDNADEYIAYLARFADHKLERKLNIVQQQIGIAMRNRQDEALHLLYIWERQIIEARIMKYDQHPPLDELTEIEKTIAEMEAFDKMTEKRQRIIAQKLPRKNPIEQIEQIPKEKPAIEVTQMKLF